VKSTLIDRLTFLKSGKAIAIECIMKEQAPPKKGKKGSKDAAAISEADIPVIINITFRLKRYQRRWLN
jgi:hypothetical protein